MLQTIHDKAKGLFAYIILIFISIPFALWGIQSYFEGGGKRLAAEVDGVEIGVQQWQQAWQQQRRRLLEAFGGNIPEGLLDDETMRQQVLQNLIREQLVQAELERAGYRIGDRQLVEIIRGMPIFQNNGRFDKTLYDRLLASQRISKAGFEMQVRLQSLRAQFRDGIVQTAALPLAAKRDYLRLADQKRRFDLGRVEAARFREQARPAEADIERYYAEHRNEFLTPEQVRVAYVRLNQAELADPSRIGEDEARTAWEEEQDAWRTPERRHLRHILIKVGEGRSEEAARREIEALRDRIRSPEDFVRLAREHSEDRITAPRGGDLGKVEPGELEEVLDRTAFSLRQGEISRPVRTARGFELILVEAIEPSRVQPFEAVRDRIVRELAEREAERAFLELTERLGTLAYEVSDTLEDAASAVEAEIRESDWFSREQGGGIAADPRVREAAFQSEVLEEGRNSDLIELSPGEVVVLRVIDRRPPAARPLDEVRDLIRNLLAQKRMRELARAEGERLLAALRAGELSWSSLADQGVKLSSHEVRRDARMPEPEVVQRVFRLGRPQGDASVVDGLPLAGGDYVLLRLRQVEDGKAGDLQRAAVLDRTYGAAEYEAVLRALEARAEITVYKENLR